MTERSKLTRKRFLQAAVWGMVAGGATAVGLNRRELLAFLREEKNDLDGYRILRRPFPAEPGREISALGFGCGARLPILGKDKSRIDEELAIALMDYVVAHGLNYFDTGYNYHNGESERFLGRALKRYPRESFWLADKMPTWLVKKPEDARRIFEEQLKRCQVGCFDNYFLHRVQDSAEYERVYKRLGVLDYLKEEQRKGRIRHLSFSFHGKSDLLRRVLDDAPWASVLVMLNALESRWNPDSLEVAKILAERKVPILIMEPLSGGRVARLNGEALRLLSESGRDWSPAEWGFRYAMSFPGALTALSGMSRKEWVAENVRTFSAERLKPLTDGERQVYGCVIDAYVKHATVPCTACRYCVPCPYGVAIPEIFTWWNGFAGAGRLPANDGGANDSQELRREFFARYAQAIGPGCGPEKCIRCKKCLSACPQWTFRIPDELRKIDRALAKVRDDYVAKGGRL